MKIKNLTPFAFGPKVTARKPPRREMVLVVRGAFVLRPGAPLVAADGLLEQGSLTSEEYLPDDDERRGEAVYPGDFADFKLRAEVLLRGTCHTPGQRPLKECPVRFAVGAWSKTLRVVGRRVWSDGLLQAATDPIPFTRMPLTWAHAFGGPGHAKNPVGKGVGGMELPNVEAPGEPVNARGDRPEPAGFGPVSSSWPDRAGKVGRDYGASWRKTRAPFYAEDFDWSFFNAAPPDQWLDGTLRGDEEVSFLNLHPRAPSFSVKLPGLRIRAFVKDDRGEIRELGTRLDTLFADPDQERLLLTWRGHTPAREDDLEDIRILLIASEPLADEPLPEAHYHALVEDFEKDPLGVEEHLQKKVPEPMRDAARRVLRGEPPLPKVPEGAPPEAIAGVLQQTLGLTNDQGGSIRAALERAIAGTGARGDLGGTMTRGLDAARGKPGARAAAPGRAPIADILGKLGTRLEAVKKVAAERNMPLAGLERIEGLLADPRIQQADPAYRPPGAPPAPPPAPLGPGVDAAGRDLSNQDLSDRDLSGANLEGALFAGAKLHGTRFKGARLRGASFARADLTEADLEGADLTRVNLSDARAPRASLRGATLEMAVVNRTDLAGAVLDGAVARTLFLTGVDLSGARARGVRFYKVIAREGVLEGLDLTEAELVECAFMECRARGLVARGAFLPRTSFAGSDLTGASFLGARGERTVWQGARLGGADFSLAVLPWSHFTQAAATGVKLYGADLRGSRFYRAVLDQADLGRANLFGADFCKAALNGTRFTDANLYDARFLGSAGAGADFTGANLKRALFEQA